MATWAYIRALQTLILRMRQLCCHPNLALVCCCFFRRTRQGHLSNYSSPQDVEQYDDPTLLAGTNLEKEVGRAKKSMGQIWVDQVRPLSCRCNVVCTADITIID